MNLVRCLVIVFCLLVVAGPALLAQAKKDAEPDKVSYYKDVRPIIQQHCQGCHQPAMAKGGLVMTSYADLFNKSDNDLAGVVRGNLKASEVYQQIIPQKGEKPKMPSSKT